MKKAKLGLILVLALSFSQVPAQETIYNNFGQGHDGWDYNYGLGWTIAGDSIVSQYGVEQAMGFEATTGGFLTDIWLAISYVPMSGFSDTVIVRIAENPNGLPPDTSDILEEWVLTEFSSWSQWNIPIHLGGSNTTELIEGSSYWIWALASDRTWTMWCMNEDPGLTCQHTIRREGEDWLSISNETASAFRVDISTGVGTGNMFSDDVVTFAQNYPNPFSTRTNISYILEYPVHTSIRIYNMLGNELGNPVNEYQTSGKHMIEFDASSLPAGMYFCSIKAGINPPVVIKMNCIK